MVNIFADIEALEVWRRSTYKEFSVWYLKTISSGTSPPCSGTLTSTGGSCTWGPAWCSRTSTTSTPLCLTPTRESWSSPTCSRSSRTSCSPSCRTPRRTPSSGTLTPTTTSGSSLTFSKALCLRSPLPRLCFTPHVRRERRCYSLQSADEEVPSGHRIPRVQLSTWPSPAPGKSLLGPPLLLKCQVSKLAGLRWGIQVNII